jgi:hypothetical protein
MNVENTMAVILIFAMMVLIWVATSFIGLDREDEAKMICDSLCHPVKVKDLYHGYTDTYCHCADGTMKHHSAKE